MTTNANNQPQRPSHQKGYNPITLEDVQGTRPFNAQDYFGELSDPVARCVAAPILAFILFFSLRMPFVAPLLILVLLGCLLARLDGQPRQVAAVPLTLAAIKLAFQMEGRLTSTLFASSYQRSAISEGDFIWLPIFFAACLVFIPKRDSLTFKIVLTGACLLLMSGLLPGEGFVVIYYMLDGILFVAIVVGVMVDIRSHYQAHPQPSLRPAQ
ncbi:MAG TPA: hypothetical protein VE077_15725 [Candidatus Methylomirabilis sp.]|nr:hypothetical protein [Candidatus Methylomirabilis sp.]